MFDSRWFLYIMACFQETMTLLRVVGPGPVIVQSVTQYYGISVYVSTAKYQNNNETQPVCIQISISTQNATHGAIFFVMVNFCGHMV